MLKVLYNGTDAPVRVDAEGREVGGVEWGVGDTTADEVKIGVASGALTVFDESTITGDSSDEAQAAKALLETRIAQAAEAKRSAAEAKKTAAAESKSSTDQGA